MQDRRTKQLPLKKEGGLPFQKVQLGPNAEHQLMQAIIQNGYGGPEILKVGRLSLPVPKDHEVLVAVEAAGVNKGDWHMLTGKPYMVRLVAGGLKRPAFQTPGQELAGRVVQVGAAVQKFKPGDEVFGDAGSGAWAEFTCVDQDSLVLMPPSIDFAQAAAMAAGGITALQTLRDILKVEPGQAILINGASGGVGSFAVQIAKSMGAVVTAVCSAKNQSLVESWGADRVIDYTTESLGDYQGQFDGMLDLVGHPSHQECRAVLKEHGRYAGVAGGQGNWLGPMGGFLKMLFTSMFTRKKMVPYFYAPKAGDLKTLAELVQSGKITPAVMRKFSLWEIEPAMALQGSGRTTGKTILEMNRS